jgi:hypothetical protein
VWQTGKKQDAGRARDRTGVAGRLDIKSKSRVLTTTLHNRKTSLEIPIKDFIDISTRQKIQFYIAIIYFSTSRVFRMHKDLSPVEPFENDQLRAQHRLETPQVHLRRIRL